MKQIQRSEGFTFKVRGKPAVAVLSVADAAAKWCLYREESGEGCSTIGNGGVVRHGKKAVAWISYNGKIWDHNPNDVRRHYAEEAQRLTNAEESAHRERMAQMAAGTYDFSTTLVEPPCAS